MISDTVENPKKRLNEKYKSLPGEFIHKGVLYSSWTSLEFIQKIENEDIFFPDDTIVATYPKSGTTVLQEIVWLISNNADIEGAKALNIYSRVPFIEYTFPYLHAHMNYRGPIINVLDKLPRPRIFKTHLMYRSLADQLSRNPGIKVVVGLRNPRDTAVSLYHFYRAVEELGCFEGTWDEFFERWYDRWIAVGDWLQSAPEWWSHRHRKNIKIVFFENIIRNSQKLIKELSVFLEKPLSEGDIETIARHTLFKNMKNNPSTNYHSAGGMDDSFVFMRKGEIGDWKNYFSKEQVQRHDEKFNPILKECGLEFEYE